MPPLRFCTTPTTLMRMPEPSVPLIPAPDLARRLDQGERVQLLDIRSAERVARGRIAFGATLDFRSLAASQLYQLPTLEPLRLDPAAPVAVICGHGNSSAKATAFLRDRGFEAYSVAGGMAAWETVYLPRRLSPTSALEHVIQVDRVGKGALSYVLVSDGDAVIVDPGRHLQPYEALLEQLGATAAAIIDTHMLGRSHTSCTPTMHGHPTTAPKAVSPTSPSPRATPSRSAAPPSSLLTCPDTRWAAWHSSPTGRSR